MKCPLCERQMEGGFPGPVASCVFEVHAQDFESILSREAIFSLFKNKRVMSRTAAVELDEVKSGVRGVTTLC